jgi:hypothetical protein
MLRGSLNAHPKIHIGLETHYFDDLRPRMAGRHSQALTPEEARECEDYFMSLLHGVYATPAARHWDPSLEKPDAPVTRDELRAMAQRCGLGADAYFEAFCRLQAETSGGERWGEKTPRHVFRIREILDRYPDSQVIFMVRDPRAVVASYGRFDKVARTGRRWHLANDGTRERELARIRGSYHPLIVTMLWRAAARAGLRARADFGRDAVYLLRFEDLVEDPASVLTSLTEWLGVEYGSSMISSLPVTNTSFGEPGKQRGISSAPTNRWRQHLSAGEVAVIQNACGRLLDELGYRREAVGRQVRAVAGAWGSLPFVAARAYLLNRHRIAGAPAYIARRIRLAVAPAGR